MASWFAAVLVVFFLGSSLLAWLKAGQCWARGAPIIECESRRPVPWGLLDIGVTLICLVALLGLGLQLVVISQGVHLGGTWTRLTVAQRAFIMLVESSVNIVVVGLSLLWLKLRVGASFKDVGVVLARLRSDIKLGARAFVMLAPPVYLLQWLLVHWFESKHPLVEMLQHKPDLWTIGISLFAAVLVAPIAEEYFFRGLLQGWLEKVAAPTRWLPMSLRLPPEVGIEPDAVPLSTNDVLLSHWSELTERAAVNEVELDTTWSKNSGVTDVPLGEPMGPYRAALAVDAAPVDHDSPCSAVWPIVVSSLVFSLLHWSHGPDWVPLFFFALGLGYLYRQTHRIVPGIVVHFLLNSFSMAMFLTELVSQGAAR